MTRDQIITANPLERFLRDHDYELRPAGGNFVTNACPVTQHKKYHRPVTIDTEKNLWHCNDCKIGGTVIDWVMYEKNVNAADAMRILGGEQNGSKPTRILAKTYDYTDEEGNLLFQTVRYVPKDFSQRQPDGKGGWILHIQGVRRVLYRLPEVIAAQTVAITEGEKDADKLCSLGITATTNPLGAGKWRDEYSETLRRKDVVIFGDVGDEKREGEIHVQTIIRSLADVAHSLKHITLPDGFHDISDYIASLPAERATQIIRKLIDETPEVDFKSGNSVDVDEPEPAELPPPPTPYRPPPLALLPSVLQEYVHAATEALNVDIAFVLLPILSSLGAAIGNSRSIILKSDYIEPPVIWTGIVSSVGTRKSPAVKAGCFAVMQHERELVQQNKEAAERYAEKLSQWEAKNRKDRGAKLEPPPALTCMMDDLTIESLIGRLEGNPRGVLLAKDEISNWIASFDQYRCGGRGADVSRWLSLHTGVQLCVDRCTDQRSYRIWDPRVCITGGIQPDILRRVMKEEFFERGLPARFLFAYPRHRQNKWSEATVTDDLRQKVLDLFDALWLLQPEKHGGACQPQLLGIDREAKDAFVSFYNKCGESGFESREREAAAWSKLTGYSARLALVGQLAREPEAQIVTGQVMSAVCELAGCFGNEAVRIYAALAETREQRDQRELLEFIKSRGGIVRIRDLMQSYAPLKNQRDEAERQLNILARFGFGKWDTVSTTARGGRPTREFRLLHLSTSTKPNEFTNENRRSCVDVDTPSIQKITPSEQAETVSVSDDFDAMPTGILEL